MIKEGRSTVYNKITSEEKLKEINPKNLELENDFIEYLKSIDRSKGTIKQYRANLHVFWCWNLEFNKNKFFVDLTKREIAKFQSHAMNQWQWSPKRIRTVKAAISSLSNYIENILDDEYDGYKPIVRKIESPADTAVRTKTVFQDNDLEILLQKLIERKQYMKACMLSLAITKGRGSRGKQLELYTLSKPFKPYLELWLEERKKLGITSDWMFPKYKNGEWIDEQVDVSLLDSWSKTFSNILGKSFYWHSLRHYFTTKLKSSGIPDSVIQDVIGWDSADMVKVYDDTPSEEQFEKYFGTNGIKEVKRTSLEDL